MTPPLFAIACDSRANSEIAQVRVKSRQEQAAYQASLRKEQMKVDSLERTLEQKVGRPLPCWQEAPVTREERRILTELSCLPEQRDRGVDKDLRRADRQDGEELASAPWPRLPPWWGGLWRRCLRKTNPSKK